MRLPIYGVALLGALNLAGTAPAQDVNIFSYEVDDREVILRWNKAAGDTLSAVQRTQVTGVAFGRYRVWRSLSPNPESFVLLRNYSLHDTTWTFDPNSAETFREYMDPDSFVVFVPDRDDVLEEPPDIEVPGPHNGIEYYYSVTWDNSRVDTVKGRPVPVYFPMQTVEEGIFGPVRPQGKANVQNPLLANVSVVPNPYNPARPAGQNAFPGAPRVQFINLPRKCQITVYTVSGDKVRTLDHDGTTDAENWDLKNQDGNNVASGVYLYRVTAEGQSTIGRFVIAR